MMQLTSVVEDLLSSSRYGLFDPVERTHRMGGWVGPGAGLEKINSFLPSGK
jgi:hypothetical protein